MDSETGTAGGQVAAAEAPKLRVFLSYSRKDSDFIVKLAPALVARGYLADYDRSTHDKDNVATGISAEDEWWKRLQEMIQAADVMVFAVSPDSAASKVCDEEVAYARSLGKRVIAVLRREIDFATAPPRLAALNVKIAIVGDDPAVFDAGVAQLSAALDRDVVWLREQTRLGLAAADWEQSARREDELLRGAEISEAEAWSARRPPSAPEVPEGVLAFLAASREAQAAREAAARRQMGVQKWLQRGVALLIVIAMMITATGGWFVVRGQQDLSVATSATLAASAAQASDAGEYDRAMRLAIIAARETWRLPAAEEASFELAKAMWGGSLEAMLPPASYAEAALPPVHIRSDMSSLWSGLEASAFSDDGEQLVMVRGASVGVAAPLQGAGAQGWSYVELMRDDTGNSTAAFEPGGRRLLVRGGDGSVRIWTETDGAWRAENVGAPAADWATWLHDGGGFVLGSGVQAWITRKTDSGWTLEALPALQLPELGFVGKVQASADGQQITGVLQVADGVFSWTRAKDGVWTLNQTRLPVEEIKPDPAAARGASQRVVASSDGRRLLNVWYPEGEPTNEPLVQVLEMASGQPLRVSQTFVADEGNAVSDGSLSASGARALVRMRDGAPEMWVRGDDGTWNFDDALPDAPVTPGAYFEFQGEHVVALNGKDVWVWSRRASYNGWTVRHLQGVNEGGSATLSADGKRLLTSGPKGARIWRLDTPSMGTLMPVPDARQYDVAVSGDIGHRILTDSKSVIGWIEGVGGESIWRTLVNVTEKPGWFTSTPSGAALMFRTTLGEEVLWREGDGWRRQQLPGSAVARCEPALSADGRNAACSFAQTPIRVWRREDGGAWAERMASGAPVKSSWTMFAPDGALLAFGPTSASVLAPGAAAWAEQVFRQGMPKITSAVFGPDATLVTSSYATSAGVQVWRREADGAYGEVLRLAGGVDRAQPVFSRDGGTLAVATREAIVVARRVDAKAGETAWRVAQTVLPAANVRGLAVLPDGNSLATVNGDGAGRVWRERADGGWSSMRLTGLVSNMIGIVLTADGTTLVVNDGQDTVMSDVSMFALPRADLVAAACGGVLRAPEFADAAGKAPVVGPRRITAEDVAAAPVLRGREGEDVCAWTPDWYDRWLDAGLGWLR